MLSQLEINLAVDRINACFWCGAQPRQPCRADKGKGEELHKSVHPVRRKPASVAAS